MTPALKRALAALMFFLLSLYVAASLDCGCQAGEDLQQQDRHADGQVVNWLAPAKIAILIRPEVDVSH